MTPKVDVWNGHPVLVLNPDSRFPFSFGEAKARMILANLDAIRAFVAQKTLDAPPANPVLGSPREEEVRGRG
jgi:hypothetical protein